MYKVKKIKLYGDDLEKQINTAYDEMLSTDSEYPFLVSTRNFIPGILDHEDGEERYIKFNRYRRTMYAKYNLDNYPTACALGSVDDSYTLIYTRSKVPMKFFNNPTQTEAFEYPQIYGKPQFSRAGVCGNDIIISGTASIRESETMYVGDVKSQFAVTMENIEILKKKSLLDKFDLAYNIYVKHQTDMDTVKELCTQYGMSGKFFNVDICRSNLLLEIEAFSVVFPY